jgi:hypothetical protein
MIMPDERQILAETTDMPLDADVLSELLEAESLRYSRRLSEEDEARLR